VSARIEPARIETAWVISGRLPAHHMPGAVFYVPPCRIRRGGATGIGTIRHPSVPPAAPFTVPSMLLCEGARRKANRRSTKAFFIPASLCLSQYSRRRASPWFRALRFHTHTTGRREGTIYRAPAPALCWATRRGIEMAMPQYRVLSRQRTRYTCQEAIGGQGRIVPHRARFLKSRLNPPYPLLRGDFEGNPH
jgi:hypothetical protein